MNPEQLLALQRNRQAVLRALDLLDGLGLDTDALRNELVLAIAELYSFVPTAPAEFHIRSAPIPISDHLTLGRDMLPCNLHPVSSAGRAYTLTKGQRAVLKDQFGLTPTAEVIVDEIATWPAAPTIVAYILIRSSEHVPASRRHLLNAATITDWVSFCARAKSIDEEAETITPARQRQLDAKKVSQPTQPTMAALLDLYS